MYYRHLTAAGLILGLALSASAATQPRKSRSKKPKAPVVQPQPVAPQPEMPPAPPPTPEQGPSNPAEVTLRGGQLTITARNSTLGDVLNSVRSKTGASVEMPPASNERVVGQFGPGAPRDVMAQLLNGSHYDYVLLGSPADPGALKRIVLTVRPTGPEQVQQASNPGPGNEPGMQPAQQMDQVELEQPTQDATADSQEEPPPQADQEEPQGVQPQQNGGPMVKTPEQLLRELQQQQQQQQQQNGQPRPQ